ncbi:MAG TPA: hypothetical protein VH089_11295, partial [Streptosporangiaceae bacterium]|nr:hypothetical protein [Streptosporangiaceae bacterium]
MPQLGVGQGLLGRRRERRHAEVGGHGHRRAAAKAIKDHTLANLDTYLLRLEASVQAAGGHVHWASDAAEAGEIVASLT